MTYATKRYADNSQRDPKWRLRHGLVHNPRANFHYPRASLKARERSEFKTKLVKDKLAEALALTDRLKRLESESGNA
jgi:hypothetical protein